MLTIKSEAMCIVVSYLADKKGTEIICNDTTLFSQKNYYLLLISLWLNYFSIYFNNIE